jgi:Cu/Ag efflux pump CusA
MGFTLNNITMLGLILAIGIVIDDAVVVHENIFRHMEEDGLDGMAYPRGSPAYRGDAQMTQAARLNPGVLVSS